MPSTTGAMVAVQASASTLVPAPTDLQPARYGAALPEAIPTPRAEEVLELIAEGTRPAISRPRW